MLALLEPPSLIEAFQTHPPLGFKALAVGSPKTPGFLTNFDLLTTLDPPLRKRMLALPGAQRLAGCFLTPRTLFCGTTVSEYLLLPEQFLFLGL